MPANIRFDSNNSEGPLTLTSHARERMATRGLRPDAIDAALAYGRVVHVRGADIYAIGRKEVARYAEDGVDLAAYEGVQVVSTDGVIVTVYRNRSFGGLRNRYSYRRRPVALAA